MTKLTKKERTASIVAGAILFVLAAIFTVAIFLKVFDYGTNSEHQGILLQLGSMLYTSYGFCSLLIPLFFIVAGSFCFDSKWSVQRALCLIVSPLPFFTLVLAEKLIRSSVLNDSHAIAFVKITFISVVSLLLIAVEYLVTIIFSGKLRKKISSTTKTDITSAPVFESSREADDETESKDKENKVAGWFASLSAKIKGLVEKSSDLTTAPVATKGELSSENTVEIVLKEDAQNEDFDNAYSDEENDDDKFQEPTIAENFFEEKKKLLADSGDNEINQIEEDEEPKSFSQKLAKPFKNIFKNVQDKFQDLKEFSEQQDKENPSPALNTIFGKKNDTENEEQEAVDINDFFKKPAERVVLKESDYSDLDLPPRPHVQDTVVKIENDSHHETLEYDSQNPTVIVDEHDDEQLPPEDEVSHEEEIDIEDINNPDADNFEEFSDDEEDIIGMFERQNQNLEDNDFLNQLADSIETPEDEEQSLEAFIDETEIEMDSPDELEAEEQTEEATQLEEENSFLAQIRQRVNAREQLKTPAQRKLEEEQAQALKEQEKAEEAERQKKLNEEKLFARIREELKAQTKKSNDFDFTPEIKSEVSTGGTDLRDVFARMDQDVQKHVDNDPSFKAQFTPQTPAAKEQEINTETKKQETPKPAQIPQDDISEIQQRHKSFIARAEALKAAKEAEQKASKDEEEKVTSSQTDYVFGSTDERDNQYSNIDPLAGDEKAESSNANDFDEEEEIDNNIFLDNEIPEDDFDEDNTESISATDYISSQEDYEDEENSEEEYFDDPVETSKENPSTEPEDYVFPSKEHRPPKPSGWKSVYNIPYDLLTAYENNPYWEIDEETKAAANNLKDTLAEFNIDAEVTGIQKGPVVTMFEILPAPGVKLNKIVGLADNIALRLAASSVRIVAPIPGKHAVGIEVPNKSRAIISIRECLEQDIPEWNKMGVPVVLGKDIQGKTQIIDLVKTPHMLIAGATGAGKSVCVNSMIVSMLYKRSPRDVKMILIDPKIVELKLYNDIPHLLTPVITDPKKAMQALQYCLCEMERRYALLDGMSVREISSYNKKIAEKHIAAEKLPYLVVIIDEFADLMATTGKQLEGVLARLAAMSRAVGIHLVLATQRPSIDVITGLIKANIPSRIAFMVASKIDSRIILDQLGAEKLLGKGDMLYTSATDPFPNRIQGTFVSDQEVENVVEAVKSWGEPEYIDEEIFVDDDEDEDSDDVSLFNPDTEDPLYEKALDIVVQSGRASASYIQRRLKIGYNRAARLVEEMEERGIVGPANGSKPREIIHMP